MSRTVTTASSVTNPPLLPYKITARDMRLHFERVNTSSTVAEEEFQIYNAYEAVLGRPEGKINPTKRRQREEAPGVNNDDNEQPRRVRIIAIAVH